MTGLETIGPAFSAIRTAVEIAQFLRSTSDSLNQAEVKLKMADLMVALADAKIEFSNMQLAMIEKAELIRQLQSKLQMVGLTVGYLGARYMVNENREPTGEPFCPTCWATDRKLVPLTSWSNKEPTHKCGSCGNTIQSRLSPLNAGSYIKRNREAAEKIGSSFEIITTP